MQIRAKNVESLKFSEQNMRYNKILNDCLLIRSHKSWKYLLRRQKYLHFKPQILWNIDFIREHPKYI